MKNRSLHRVCLATALSLSLGLVSLASGIGTSSSSNEKQDEDLCWRLSCNPIIPEGTFFSDPAPRIGPDGTLWLFGSRDEKCDIYCSYSNDAIETKDLKNLRLHRDVLVSRGTGDAIPGTDALLWAPDAIFHNGKWLLFYCTPDDNHKEGIAIAPSPAGPFADSVRLAGCNGIDPSIFRDDDGTLYYNWGQAALHGAILKDDASGFVEGTIHDAIIDEERHNFHEGVQLTKRNGIYYLVFADIGRRRTPSCIGYATSSSPFGPYVYRGVIVDNRGCDPNNWNNHGGIVEFGGKWYVFYHRATNASRMMRKVCVEPIEFDANGFIREVETTSNGAASELDPFAETPARIACEMSGNVRIVTDVDGKESLREIRTGDTAIWRYFNFQNEADGLVLRLKSFSGGQIELCDGEGASYGRIQFQPGDGREVQEVSMHLDRPFPKGRRAIVLRFRGKGRGATLFELASFHFTSKDQ